MIRSATAAYRLDRENRPDAFGPHDGAWVAVASLLEQAAVVAEDLAPTLVRDAVEVATDTLGAAHVVRSGQREFGDESREATEAILLLSDACYQSGALHTARAMLEALMAGDRGASAIQRGRALVRVARINNKLGYLDDAKDQLTDARRLAKTIASVELEVRALIGLGGLAQSRGNYPEMRRYATRAAQLADRGGLRHLARFAHTGLMIAAAERKEFDMALRHAAIVHRASTGTPMEEAEILQNVGQLFLLAGYPGFAEGIFRSVLARPLPERIMLSALGGLALASAKNGRPEVVRWSAAETERLHNAGAQRYQVAIALLECAIALLTIGETDAGTRLRGIALELGERHGYNEVIIRADIAAREIVGTTAPTPTLRRETIAFAKGFQSSEPEQLPRHVSVAAPA